MVPLAERLRHKASEHPVRFYPLRVDEESKDGRMTSSEGLGNTPRQEWLHGSVMRSLSEKLAKLRLER
ncbi:MAG: hypothetical protein NZ992_01380 [Candidatus Korarchaeum sp.]|nr:hypothetical protein [Candidatus Korarchaeum sp.]MDW8036173.1 hypothetical protein [Candidatus Korarchaeum sp.]